VPCTLYFLILSPQGELVYANYGSAADFRELKEMGIYCKDKILLIRYGQLARNKKVFLVCPCVDFMINPFLTLQIQTNLCTVVVTPSPLSYNLQ